MSVISRENKQLLSQILGHHPLKKNNPQGFLQFLETQLNIVHQSRFRYNNDLTRMNKEVIRKFQEIIPPPEPSPWKGAGATTFAHTGGGGADNEEEVPKIKIFETRLKEQQEHFNSLIKAEVPEDIDFSDKTIEGGLISTTVMDETMQQRQDELKKIMSTYQKKDKKETEAWIKGEASNPDNVPDIISSPQNSIIKIPGTKTSSDKHVSFEVIETSNTDLAADNFLSKLKVKKSDIELPTTANPNYSDYFIKIIENQELILAELVKLNTEGVKPKSNFN